MDKALTSTRTCTHTHTPAMYNHGSCIWRVAGLDPTKEGQEGGRVFRHPVVWPGCELEVTNLTLFIGAALDKQRDC